MTHVIITGGSSGIGLAVARIYAARGARISLVARTASRLADAREALATSAGTGMLVHVECADVGDEAATVTAISACETALGPCDILVCCAGIVEPDAFDAQSSADFERQIRSNLLGTVHAVRAVYAGMKERRSGRIMLISSGAGLIGIYGYTAYCASKFALHGFAQALRFEAKPEGVQVSVCFPPDTRTPQFDAEITRRPPEASALMGTVPPWTADAVAAITVRAIDRGRFEVFFGWTLAALGRFGPLVRPLLNRWFDRAIERSRRG